MRTLPLTRSVALAPFLDLLDEGGCPVEPLLRKTRIDPEILQKPESYLSFQLATRFIERAAHREGIDDFGLQAGARTSITRLGLFGMVLANSLTLKDLVRRLIRWVPLVNTGARVTVGVAGEEKVEIRAHYLAEEGRVQFDSYILMCMLDGIRMALGLDWRPREIALNAVAGSVVRRQEAFSEAKVNSKVDYVGVQIPRSSLALPLRARETPRNAKAERLLQATAPPSDFAATLVLALKGMLNQGPPKIEMAAEMAGMSVRTLQRRLSERGTEYGSLLDRILFEKAIELMDQPGIRLAEIAFRLGYSDPANFTRAFCRWTGVSPKAFHKRRIQASEAAVCRP